MRSRPGWWEEEADALSWFLARPGRGGVRKGRKMRWACSLARIGAYKGRERVRVSDVIKGENG